MHPGWRQLLIAQRNHEFDSAKVIDPRNIEQYVLDNVPGNGGDVTVIDPGVAAQSARFYRVRVLL